MGPLRIRTDRASCHHRALAPEALGEGEDGQGCEEGACVLDRDHDRRDGGVVLEAEVILVGFEREHAAHDARVVAEEEAYGVVSISRASNELPIAASLPEVQMKKPKK